MTMKNEKTRELVEKTLSVFPLMTKKLFGPVHVLAEEDLHHTHFHILHVIAEAEKIRTTEIAQKLGMRKSNLTPLLNKLVSKNFIQREQGEKDRRAIIITLTSEGHTFMLQKKSILDTEVEKRLQQLSEADQEKLRNAVNDLNQVIGKLEN